MKTTRSVRISRGCHADQRHWVKVRLVPQGDSRAAEVDLARRNSEQVLAESALKGERLVRWARLATLALIVGSQVVADSVAPGVEVEVEDEARPLLVQVYLAFSIFVAWRLGKVRAHPKQELWVPFLVMVVDFGFYRWLAHLQVLDEGVAPDIAETAVINAVLLSWSVARLSSLHLVFGTVLATACYVQTVMMAPQSGDLDTHLFVIGSYVGLGLLIGATRRRTKEMFVDLRKRDFLSRFLPRQVADQMIAEGEVALRPTQREVTVVFTDIRDFTSMSEKLEPEAVLSFLDDYLGRMSAVVKAQDGMVNKFLGDGMLAVWGVPQLQPDHAERALRCAQEMRKELVALNAQRTSRGMPAIRVGMGIHTGIVAAGMLGGADQHEYAVIGDAVNLASRIESLTKSLGRDCLVSEATWSRIQGSFELRRVGEVEVKGRLEKATVYSLEEPRQLESDSAAAAAPLPPREQAG